MKLIWKSFYFFVIPPIYSEENLELLNENVEDESKERKKKKFYCVVEMRLKIGWN